MYGFGDMGELKDGWMSRGWNGVGGRSGVFF